MKLPRWLGWIAAIAGVIAFFTRRSSRPQEPSVAPEDLAQAQHAEVDARAELDRREIEHERVEKRSDVDRASNADIIRLALLEQRRRRAAGHDGRPGGDDPGPDG